MADTFGTVGIMFAKHSDGDFPTVREVNSAYGWLNADGMDLGEVWDWYAIAYDPRGLGYADEDRRAMNVTNWDAIIAECGGVSASIRWEWRRTDTDGLDDALMARTATVRGVSGTVLVVAPDARQYPDTEYLDDENPDLLIDRMRELSRALADGALLDEDAYYAREWEAWQEYAPMALSDEIRDARRDGAYEEEWLDSVEERDADDVLGQVCQYLDYYYGFSGEYGPEMLGILADIEKGEVK